MEPVLLDKIEKWFTVVGLMGFDYENMIENHNEYDYINDPEHGDIIGLMEQLKEIQKRKDDPNDVTMQAALLSLEMGADPDWVYVYDNHLDEKRIAEERALEEERSKKLAEAEANNKLVQRLRDVYKLTFHRNHRFTNCTNFTFEMKDGTVVTGRHNRTTTLWHPHDNKFVFEWRDGKNKFHRYSWKIPYNCSKLYTPSLPSNWATKNDTQEHLAYAMVARIVLNNLKPKCFEGFVRPSK